ncbi:hypothetical protein BpHYR1_022805 [Brachionus plicatilis]|uniref:Uncharacterized protein n=1 Tax=Brachionus plicatilis TaxID=10195 RepID=A0A3M7SYB1_BRAPC|nr:hypothetical protein BpHYR1_022805 [Brachionus plicatilis]
MVKLRKINNESVAYIISSLDHKINKFIRKSFFFVFLFLTFHRPRGVCSINKKRIINGVVISVFFFLFILTNLRAIDQLTKATIGQGCVCFRFASRAGGHTVRGVFSARLVTDGSVTLVLQLVNELVFTPVSVAGLLELLELLFKL